MTMEAYARIGDTCLVGDGTHSKVERHDSGVLYLTSRNFKDGSLDLSKVYYISESDYARHFLGESKALARPQADDLVFSIIGTIGEPYLVRRSDSFGISSSVAIVRPEREIIDPTFLLHWFKGPVFQNALFGIKGGVAQGYVSLEMIRSLPVPKLPLPVQRRIAGILSAYDELMENSQRRNRLLEAMARVLYREWFVHFRFPGHEKLQRVASSLGEIPQGWEVKPLFDLAKVNYGKNLPTKNLVEDGPYPVYGAAKIIGRHTEYTRERRTIICGCRGSVGEMQITQPQCFVTNNSFTFDPTHPDNFFWLFHSLEERGLRDVIGGAAQPQITLEGISSVELVTPPLPIRTRYQQTVSAMFEEAWALDNQIQNLRRTRDLLLPRLLSGKLEFQLK
jgi:type I restriction enzyme, S subunit